MEQFRAKKIHRNQLQINFMKKIITIILLATSLSVSANWLTPELLWKLGRVSDPQLSPDGSRVAYCITRYNVAANKGNSDIWIFDFNSNSVKALAADSGNENMPRWSRDGKTIFYLNDINGSQLWSMNGDGSTKQQVSKLSSDVNAYGISANNEMVWVCMDVKLDNFRGNDKYPDLPKSTARIYDDLMMRHWNQWADGTYSHVFIAQLKNGKIETEPKDIMKGEKFDSPLKPEGGDEEIAWSPDGKQLAYTCKKLSGREYAISTNSEIFLYDVATGKTTNLTEDNPAYDKAPVFSPDGKSIAWISWEEAGNEASLQRLFTMDLKTKVKKNWTQNFEYNVSALRWTKSERIYFLADSAATDQIFFIDVASKSTVVKQLTNDIADYIAFSVETVASKTDKIVGARQSISEPTELFTVDNKTGVSNQITFTNKDVLAPLTLGDVKKFIIKTSDGKDMLTWVIYPPNFNPKNKYPTLLYCQGGPQSTVSQFFSYRWNFQLMAANGYIVVAPNRRGLPGFGKEWNDEISTDWGGQAMKDLLSAIDSVAKQPYVNKDKLGAVGASFGGYSVFWLAGNHQHRFKAFISHCGVFNFESMLATEELFFYNYENDGVYWRSPKPKSYEKFSPNKFVGSWDTPILIISNDRDYRIPYSQGLEAYSAARYKNIPARFVNFPDEGHWVLRPQNSITWQREFFGWLDKYLK
jgi:dipeptidyl aminopeptidase/acylaminoacyl peptidase